jgi:hypothetical protein
MINFKLCENSKENTTNHNSFSNNVDHQIKNLFKLDKLKAVHAAVGHNIFSESSKCQTGLST